MCIGIERLRLLRESYRLGYASGYADAMAKIQATDLHQPDEKVIWLEDIREERAKRKAN